MKQKTIPIIFAAAIVLLGMKVFQANAERSVIDSERGMQGSYPPFNNEWSKIGADFAFGPSAFSSLKDEAVKLVHGRFQHFFPADDGNLARFPFFQFSAYDQDEKNQGRDSMFVSANYADKDRQVYYTSYSDQCPLTEGATCNLPDNQLKSVINLRDDRYVKYYVNEYARRIEHDGNAMNIWDSNDNCGFGYGYYYLLDDDRKVHVWGSGNTQNFSWNNPYAQNYEYFVQDIRYFAAKIKEYAPDIKLFWNGLGDDSRFAEISQNVDGHMEEAPLGEYKLGMSDQGWRNRFYYRLNNDQIADNIGKTMYYRADFSGLSGDDYKNRLKNYYLAYLIFKGDNYFFYPSQSSKEVNPADYITIQNNLGKPLEPAQNEKGSSWLYWNEKRLYSRKFEGGIVYYNVTGEIDKAITLPTDKTYYDPDTGNPVTQITVPDMCQTAIYATTLSNSPCGTNNTVKSAGAYVVTTPGTRAAVPQAFPQEGSFSGGEVEVSLESQTSGAQIRYTLDGTEPTNASTLYTAPFKITSTKTLKAKSFASGYLDSFQAEKTYTISGEPTVELHLSSDSGSEFLDTAYGLVKLSQPSGKEVAVNYSITGGAAIKGQDYNLSNGTLNFRKGEQYKYFPIKIINDYLSENGETIEITISDPTNANLGSKKTFAYTIEDNDRNRAQSLNYLDVMADMDTTINPTNPTSNNGGNSTLLYVGNGSEALLHFDLSAIPQNAVIDSAHLKIFGSIFDDNKDGQVNASVFRLLRDWKENEVTWNKANNLTDWSVSGAQGEDIDRAKTATDTKDMIGSVYFEPIYWDLSGDVQKMVSGEYENKGWLVQGPPNGQGSFNFYPRDRANQSYIFKPRLRITYTTPISLSADLNLDGSINQADLDILKTDFLKLTASLTSPRSDINADGQCTARDLGILMSGWK